MNRVSCRSKVKWVAERWELLSFEIERYRSTLLTTECTVPICPLREPWWSVLVSFLPRPRLILCIGAGSAWLPNGRACFEGCTESFAREPKPRLTSGKGTTKIPSKRRLASAYDLCPVRDDDGSRAREPGSEGPHKTKITSRHATQASPRLYEWIPVLPARSGTNLYAGNEGQGVAHSATNILVGLLSACRGQSIHCNWQPKAERRGARTDK